MAEIDVLINGYVREDIHVTGTVSLVRTKGIIMVVDPGIVKSLDEYYHSLKSVAGIAPEQVTDVFVTHHHIDHTRNIGLFTKARVIDYASTYDGDLWEDHQGDGFEISPEIRVLQTPGHSEECASLVVQSPRGVVVCTHLWWHSDFTPEVDPMAQNQELLEKNRKRILGIADWIIPGHGPIARVKK
jgi:glyoxylase-like metal-dependent hydrolase (beta-lactamase superfamily II)